MKKNDAVAKVVKATGKSLKRYEKELRKYADKVPSPVWERPATGALVLGGIIVLVSTVSVIIGLLSRKPDVVLEEDTVEVTEDAVGA